MVNTKMRTWEHRSSRAAADPHGSPISGLKNGKDARLHHNVCVHYSGFITKCLSHKDLKSLTVITEQRLQTVLHTIRLPSSMLLRQTVRDAHCSSCRYTSRFRLWSPDSFSFTPMLVRSFLNSLRPTVY